MNDWAYQWKINFNPDCFKQAQEEKLRAKIIPAYISITIL